MSIHSGSHQSFPARATALSHTLRPCEPTRRRRALKWPLCSTFLRFYGSRTTLYETLGADNSFLGVGWTNVCKLHGIERKHLPKLDFNDFFLRIHSSEYIIPRPQRRLLDNNRKQTSGAQEAVRHARQIILEFEQRGYITGDHTEERHAMWQFLDFAFISSADTRETEIKSASHGCEF